MPNNLMQELWDLLIALIKAVGGIWDWLNEPLKIGLDLGVLGYIGVPPFTPISAFGVGILVIIGLWAVKSLLPLG